MAEGKGCFVIPEFGLLPIRYDHEPYLYRMNVNNRQKGIVVGYFPRFDDWEIDVPVVLYTANMSKESFLVLFADAGDRVGLGKGRPYVKGSSTPGLGFGRWEIGTVKVLG